MKISYTLTGFVFSLVNNAILPLNSVIVYVMIFSVASSFTDDVGVCDRSLIEFENIDVSEINDMIIVKI